MGAVIGDVVLAGLGEGVTDHGLRALANAGCGRMLTSLTLWGELPSLFVALKSWGSTLKILFQGRIRRWCISRQLLASRTSISSRPYKFTGSGASLAGIVRC